MAFISHLVVRCFAEFLHTEGSQTSIHKVQYSLRSLTVKLFYKQTHIMLAFYPNTWNNSGVQLHLRPYRQVKITIALLLRIGRLRFCPYFFNIDVKKTFLRFFIFKKTFLTFLFF